MNNNLGFIPSFQFDMNPANNPQVVNMAFPPGMDQTTVQPVGPYYWHNGMNGLGQPIDTVNAVFESWWWRNRKWLVLGGVAALGLGILGGVAAILK